MIDLAAPIEIIGQTGKPEDVVVKNTQTIYGVTENHVARLNHADAIIRNMTLTGGRTRNQRGGNVRIYAAGGSLVNCIITDGLIESGYYGSGSAIHSDATANVLISHCVITNNAMLVSAGGGTDSSAVFFSGGTMINCLIANNTDSLSAHTRNTAGGVYLKGGTMINCTVYGNHSSSTSATGSAGGVLMAGGTLLNCAIAGNTRRGGDGEDPILASSIAFVSSGSPANISKSVSDTGDGVAGEWVVVPTLDGLFHNPDEGNFMPGRASALLDAGTAYPGAASDTDLAGNDRIIGSAIDIGCYEQTGDLPSAMYVSGYPDEYGTPNPAYGKIEDGSANTTYTMDALTISDDELSKYHCVGYIIYTNDAQAAWHEELSGEGLSVQYATQLGRDSKLEWQFAREFYVETSGLNVFGSVSGSDWYDEGDEVTAVATPDEGFEVSAWIVNGVLQPDASGSTFKWTVAEPTTIVANFVPAGSAGNIQYVAETGDDSASGYLVDDPKKTIHAAVAELALTVGSGTVYVAPGVYPLERNNAVYITNAISVIGSSGIPSDVVVSNKYSASYTDKNNIFYIDHKDALVASLTMTHGQLNQAQNQSGGYNVYVGADGGTVSNCVIQSGGSIHPHNSGAVYLRGTDALLIHSIVRNCWNSTAETVGWPGQNGIAITMTAGRVESCLVDGNRVTSATYATEPKSSIIYATGGTIVNTTLVNNEARRSGAFSVSGTAEVINCAVIGNKNINEEDPMVSDVWIGQAENFVACLSDSAEPINESCFTTDLPLNQIFRERQGAAYFPAPGSPLINQGINWDGAEQATDLAGNPRRIGTRVDIGCYESPAESFLIIIR